MPTQIYNTASLSFECGTQKGFVSSNIAVTTMQEAVSVSKTSLSESYFQSSEIPFIIEITNNGFEEIKNLTVQDNLGSYTLKQSICGSKFTPLTYIGPSLLYIAGKFSSNLTPTTLQNKIEFKIESIPAKSTALIIYKTTTNEFSPLALDSEITNTVTVTSENLSNIKEASSTVKVKNSADIKIIKNMSPNPVLAGEKITYSFSLYNYGNTEATNVVLTDTLSPFPSNISVKLDSNDLQTTHFSYIDGNLTIPSANSDLSISIPAAKFIQNNITGLISVKPGITTITVSGQI